jgi:hypothetical protein
LTDSPHLAVQTRSISMATLSGELVRASELFQISKIRRLVSSEDFRVLIQMKMFMGLGGNTLYSKSNLYIINHKISRNQSSVLIVSNAYHDPVGGFIVVLSVISEKKLYKTKVV